MRLGLCPVCRRRRVVVRLKKADPWKIRGHFTPGDDAVGDRRKNGPCPGSGRTVLQEDTVPA